MRILSLCPSLTELVFDLGRGADLVGCTTFCVHPAEGVAQVEKVGGTKTPQVDRIIEIRPDLVLLNEEENRIEDAEALREAGVPCHVSFPKTWEDTAQMIRSISAALEREGAGEALARDLEQRAVRVRDDSKGASKVRYAYFIWRKPWMVAGGDTFVNSLLDLAGGVNAFGEHPDRYPEVSPEELRTAQVDALLLSSEPFPFTERHRDEVAAVTGLSADRCWLVDGEFLTWHGSRTPAGIDYAQRCIEACRSRI